MNAKAEALAAAKKRIVELQAQMTSRILQMAAEVEKLLDVATEKEAREFLRVSCNLPSSELSTYVEFGKVLKGNERLLSKARVSFPVLKSLVSANDDVRQEVLERLEIGARIDSREISAIRRRLTETEIGRDGIEAQRHGRMVSTAARKRGGDIAADLKRRLSAFLDDLPCAYSEMKTSEIRKEAARLHRGFVRVFGASEGDVDFSNRETVADALALAMVTLRRLADGTLERPANVGRTARHPGIAALRSFTGRAYAEYPRDFSNIDQVPPVRHRKKVLELCAGAGGMALGLERAGYEHVALVEYDKHAAATLRNNRPDWNVIEGDIREKDFTPFLKDKIDLVSGGLPCQPYSTDGKTLGKDDPRDLFPEGVRVVREVQPKAFLFENVDGFLHAAHADHVADILRDFRAAGYHVDIHRIKAEDYGVAQQRSRVLIVGLRNDLVGAFRMPPRFLDRRTNIGDALVDLMSANGWTGAQEWARARREQPILNASGEIVGHGVLASTMTGRRGVPRAKEAQRWAEKGVNIGGIPDAAPTLEEASAPGFLPGITLKMRAKLQDFPDDWQFCGGKDAVAMQIGNAVPPTLAQAVGLALFSAMTEVSWNWEAMLWPETERAAVAAPPLSDDRAGLDLVHEQALENV